MITTFDSWVHSQETKSTLQSCGGVFSRWLKAYEKFVPLAMARKTTSFFKNIFWMLDFEIFFWELSKWIVLNHGKMCNLQGFHQVSLLSPPPHRSGCRYCCIYFSQNSLLTFGNGAIYLEARVNNRNIYIYIYVCVYVYGMFYLFGLYLNAWLPFGGLCHFDPRVCAGKKHHVVV